MEHSKEFYIQHFLQENNFKRVELDTIKTIYRLYKILKWNSKNTSTKQLPHAFSNFIDNIKPAKDEKKPPQHLQPLTLTSAHDDFKQPHHQQQYIQPQNTYTDTQPFIESSSTKALTGFQVNDHILYNTKHHK